MRNLFTMLAAGGGLALLLAGPATSPVRAQTTTFAYTGSPESYTVPAGVTSLQVEATGAAGGTAYQTGSGSSAYGARVRATLAVTAGEVLTVRVGGQGATGNGDSNSLNAGGFNGGGRGTGYGGGGGATDLRRAAARASTGDYLTGRNALLVAGGAGGSFNSGQAIGGAGGAPDGGSGRNPLSSSLNIYNGGGATQAGPGAAGAAGTSTPEPGSNNNGGNSPAGSGGGGGYYGGGASNSGAGGGGGSSWVTAGATGVSYDVAYAPANGRLLITAVAPTFSAPTITSLAPASGAVGSLLTLTGTNLSGATAVSFNGTAAPGFTVVNATTITATVPTGATSGNVTVTTPGGTSNGLVFTVTTPLLITNLAPTPNTIATPARTPVQVTFNQPLAASSASALQVFSAQQGGRCTRVQPAKVSGNQLTFTPTLPYQPGEVLSATVTTAAQSSTGTTLATPYAYQFTAATGGSGRGGFGGGSDPAVGSNPNSVAVGDVNGDGFLDLVTANIISNSASVRLNNGQGSFGGSQDVGVGSGPYNVVLGDVDGDGDLDLLTANVNSNSVSVRLNDGKGTFSGAQEVNVGTGPNAVTVGDLDGDGDLDFVTANGGSNNASVRLNNGQGSFSGGSEVPVGNMPGGVVLGDVDGDGDLDLLTVNSNIGTNNAGTVSVRLNNGQGNFSGAQEVPTNGNPQYGLALGDVDGDGDLDVLAGNNNGSSVAVRLNDGQGNFSGSQNVGVGYAYSLAVGDVDADGDLDFVTANNGNTASVRLNDGQGNFSGTQNVAVGNQPAGVVLGDVDGDGDLDFITANSDTGPNGTAGSVSVRLNLAPPTLTSLSPSSGPVGTRVTLTGTNFASASTVTFNGTTASAVTVASTTSLTATVPAGASSGNVTVTTPSGVSSGLAFIVTTPLLITNLAPTPNAVATPATSPVQVTFSKPLAASSASALQVFSAQRAGRLTATQPATANGNQLTFSPSYAYQPGEVLSATVTTAAQSSTGSSLATPYVYQFTAATSGSGRGGFAPGSEVTVGTSPNAIAVGDMDADGDLDLLVANTIGNTVSVRLNEGKGTFGSAQEVAVGYQPYSVAVGDVDGDGDLDFVAANSGDNSVSVRLNDGKGTFSGTQEVGVDGGPQGVTLGDVDGDGDLDLVTANYLSSGTASVRLNDGKGAFSGGNNVAVGSYPAGVALGDVDGDGDLDLLAVNTNLSVSNGGTVSVRLNDGKGNFRGTQEVPTNGNPQGGLAVGDVDGDGDLDLLAGNNSGSSVAVRLNDGKGTFGGTQNVPTGNAYNVVVGDVDADGDLDFVAANNSYNTVSVRLNDGKGTFGGMQNVPVGQGPIGVALGDLDGDGDLDFATANGGSNLASVRLNLAPPTLTSLSPTSGPVGTRVTLTGTNFASASTVTFNGTTASAVTVASTTSLTATVPAGASSGNVTVTTPSGVSSGLPFTVLAPVTLSPTTLPNGTVGVAYSQRFTAAGGAAPYSYAIMAGSLPAGLTLSSGGALAGTPTAGGSFTFTVTATDASTAPGPYSGSQAYTLTLNAPIITLNPPSPLPNGTVGVAYSQSFTASGGTASYSYVILAGSLPAGLTLASNGTLSGTPTQNGSFTFTVTATDASTGSGPYSGQQAYTLAIAAPAVTSVGWTGNTSTDWFDASNWNPMQVPDATLDASIPTAPSGNRFPLLGANAARATARNLSIASGASLTMSANTLTLAANLTNNGTFTGYYGSGNSATGGTLVLGGSALGLLNGGGVNRFWNLSIGASGAQLNNTSSTSVSRLLTLSGNLATQGNSFVLVSDANGTALVVNSGGVVSGNATVQRYLSGTNVGYRHFSPSIGTATVGSLAIAGGFTPDVSQGAAYNASATPGLVTPFPTVFGYDQRRSATVSSNFSPFDQGWVAPTALTDALAVGKGYAVNLAGQQTFSMSGPLTSGDQPTQTLAYTGSGQGYHLLGNPYPAPLDLSLVAAADRSGLTGAVYTFTSSAQYQGTYSTYVLPTGSNPGVGSTSPSGPSSLLPQSQGFFVQVATAGTSGTFTFRNSQRLTSYANPTYQRTQAETRPLAQLTLQPSSGSGSSSALADQLYVYFDPAASDGYDASFDARKLPNPTGLNLAAMLASGAQLAIAGQAPLASTPRVVPLAVGVPAAGRYTLAAAQLLNLAAAPVYLRDKLTGAVVDLHQQSSYAFTISDASAPVTGRFELVFSPQQALATAPAALAQQVGLYPNPATGTTYVALPASLGREAVAATLIDAVGRQVRTLTLPAQGSVAHALDLHELPSGVYALRLQTSAGLLIKRLTVN